MRMAHSIPHCQSLSLLLRSGWGKPRYRLGRIGEKCWGALQVRGRLSGSLKRTKPTRCVSDGQETRSLELRTC